MHARAFNFNQTVDCPLCGGNNAHMVDVTVRQDTNKTVVDHRGARNEICNRAGRGSLVEVAFVGECLHRWRVAHLFHKGSTYMQVFLDEEATNDLFPPCLWRD